MTPSPANTFVETVAISEIRADTAVWITRYCAASEGEWLVQKPLSTIAGQIAVKRAICQLAVTLFDIPAFNPKALVISRRENGAPYIEAVAEVTPKAERQLLQHVLISISHSRDTAAGLAVYRGN